MWYSWFIMIKPISVLPHLLNWISYWIDFFWKFVNWIIFWIEFFWQVLNWIIFWIEFLWKILNWIIFWIEFSWNTIELNIELNNFLAKFKYWIESIWVSLTPNLVKFILAISVPSGPDEMLTNMFASETSLHCRSQ